MTWASVEDQIDYYTYKDPISGCWIWLAGLTPDGYAYGTKIGTGRSGTVHRISYNFYKGQIKKGYEIDHLCRVRCCVNPDHLEMVSHIENIKRGIYPKETHRCGRQTHCKRGHPFDKENTTFEIWKGRLRRKCRICKNIMQNKNYAKRKGLSL